MYFIMLSQDTFNSHLNFGTTAQISSWFFVSTRYITIFWAYEATILKHKPSRTFYIESAKIFCIAILPSYQHQPFIGSSILTINKESCFIKKNKLYGSTVLDHFMCHHVPELYFRSAAWARNYTL